MKAPVPILTSLLFFHLSCAGSTNHGITTTPSPQATPAGSSSSGPLWQSVTEVVTACATSACSTSSTFSAHNDGTYYIGVNTAAPVGQITVTELASLDAVANPVAAQAGTGLSCTVNGPSVGSPNYTLTLAYNDQSTRQIASVNTTNSCYFGNSELDMQLHQQMQQLEQKYNPVNAP